MKHLKAFGLGALVTGILFLLPAGKQVIENKINGYIDDRIHAYINGRVADIYEDLATLHPGRVHYTRHGGAYIQ